MSMGYSGYADLVQVDDAMAIYSYCCYNLNNDDYICFANRKDGELYIDRDAFVEPEIHKKQRNRPPEERGLSRNVLFVMSHLMR